jgi:hypothetical protein
MRELFRRVARPLAEPGTPGAWYRGRRLVSFDGTTLDVPDLERHFGRPPASRGHSGFPQVRLLALLETGTHAIFAAVTAGYANSEVRLAREIVTHLEPGMLCLADRAFLGYALWRDAAATGADLLWRVRSRDILPCLERLADGSYLSRLYPSPQHRLRDRAGLTVRVIGCRACPAAIRSIGWSRRSGTPRRRPPPTWRRCIMSAGKTRSCWPRSR